MPTGRGAWVLFALVAVAAFLVRRELDVVEVRGRSMAPALLPGDRLLVHRAAARIGDVVLAPDPREPGRELIKRVVAVDGSRLTLRGDASGVRNLPSSAVRWRVVVRYWPLRCIGRVPLPIIPEEGGEDACTFPEALISAPRRVLR